MKIEALRYELVKVAKEVGNHKIVAEIAGISIAYLAQIRTGKNAKLDTDENINLLSALIKIYRNIGKTKINSLNRVLN